ncbi:hypothetical protein ABLE91_17855 [Aquabacter sp. CN5-332]|uniref:hypothetical protein n=1 Tax=Aquabacter sp. CN5-332 TaxID=3156608 RepID=UPI0032B4B29D
MRPVPALFGALLITFGLGTAEAATSTAKTKSTKSTTAKPSAPVDTRVWSVVRGEGTYVLRFGQPRDPDPVFAATCQPSAQLLQIAIEVEGKPFASGDGVPLSLTNGKRRLELAATAFLGSSDGALVVEAAVALEPRVFDLFRAGDTLNAKMPAAIPKMPSVNQSFPLANARARLADFEASCLSRR